MPSAVKMFFSCQYVNGSWTPPAGSPDLDVTNPTYFDDLALLLGVPKDQWGGGP